MRPGHSGVETALVQGFVPIYALSPEHRDELASSATVVSVPPGEVIRGERLGSDFTYYVLDGELEIYTGDELVETLRGGTESARFALSRLRSNQVAARAKTPLNLLRVDISLLSTLMIWAQTSTESPLSADEFDHTSGWVPRLLQSELFSRIPPASIPRIFACMQELPVKAGDTIVEEGHAGENYYVIRRGRCSVSRRPGDGAPAVRLAELRPGDGFGEESLINGSSNATVAMMTDGVLMQLKKTDFEELLSNPMLSLVSRDEAEVLVRNGAWWIDVRATVKHQKDGIRNSLNIPLADVRGKADKLERQRPYVVYCDEGRGSLAAAFFLTELGFNAYVLEGGLNEGPRENTDAKTEIELDAQRWSDELRVADQEVAQALKKKLEATAARRLFSEERLQIPTGRANVKLATEQKKLELESASASSALAQAQRRKLELEAKIRAAEAHAARRRIEAETACQNLRKEAKTRLRKEDQRLRSEYARAAARMDELKRTREETEKRLVLEQKRIEEELIRSKASLEAEARKVREGLEQIRRSAETKAERIMSAEATQEERLRAETEKLLRQERQRLEAEFARSTAQLDQAQRGLEEAEASQQSLERETQRITAELRAEDEKRWAEAEANRVKEQEKADRKAALAEEELVAAQHNQQRAEEQRLAALADLARIQNCTKQLAAKTARLSEAEAQAELEDSEAKVSAASNQVDAAREAKANVDASRSAVRQRAARERATEKELRVRLQEETEAWLREEQERSQAELNEARRELAEKWSLMEDTKQKRRIAVESSVDLLDDISSQLADAVGAKAFAEEKTARTSAAREEAGIQKQKALDDLHRAREHIERLKRNSAS
jgi:rhodanese-related sulfurtransferase